VGTQPLADLRTKMVRALIRGKVLDQFRLLRRWFVVAVDGTGLVFFHRRHCAHCLTTTIDARTYYYHNALEAKLVTASGMAFSVGSVLIDNRHMEGLSAQDAEAVKQDCELKALARLAPQLKAAFPQTPLCIAGDSLLACGPVFKICNDNGWAFALTFKPGRTPACWEEFQALVKLDCRGGAGGRSPLVSKTPDRVRQEYGWVNSMPYVDSEGRQFLLNAIQCVETSEGKGLPAESRQGRTFAWLTNISVTDKTVAAIARYAGRDRWKIENSGFNTQKNGGYELEHVYGKRPDLMECYYILLQIAHMIWQLVEKGSLRRKAAEKQGKSVIGLYGSVRNLARQLLECLRCHQLPPEAFEPARRFQIRLNSS
jgi:hypothetical protein